MRDDRDYRRAVAFALANDQTCVHEVPAGDLVRPRTNTPACALCRRRHPVHWRRLPPADPRPADITAIAGSRRLW